MRRPAVFLSLLLTLGLAASFGQQNSDSIHKMEASGDTLGARTALARAVEASPNSVSALTAYAEFLQRYGDPASRQVYEKLLTALRNSGDSAREGAIARRLAALDLLAGDSAAAARHLDAYRSASGKPAGLWPPASSEERPATVNHSRPAALVRPHGGDFAGCRAGRRPAGAGAQRGHQRLPGLPQQRSAGTDRVPQAGAPLSFAGARTGEAGRRCARSSRSRPAIPPTVADLLAHPGLSHARRLRIGSGARNRERGARLPDHRFRLSAERAGRGAAHQPAVHLRFSSQPGAGAVRPGILAAARNKEAPDFIEDVHLRSRRCAASIWGFPSSIRDTAEELRKEHHLHPPASLRARAGFLRRHVRDPRRQGRGSRRRARPRRPGPNWWALRRIRAPSSSTSW